MTNRPSEPSTPTPEQQQAAFRRALTMTASTFLVSAVVIGVIAATVLASPEATPSIAMTLVPVALGLVCAVLIPVARRAAQRPSGQQTGDADAEGVQRLARSLIVVAALAELPVFASVALVVGFEAWYGVAIVGAIVTVALVIAFAWPARARVATALARS